MSDFANQCLQLSGSILKHVLAGTHGAVIMPGAQRYSFYPPEGHSGLPSTGTIEDLTSWIRGHVTGYDARENLRRIAYEGPDFCIITCCPCVRLRATSLMGAGRVSMLISCVWQRTDGEPALVHAHLSLIGITLESSKPSGGDILLRIPVPPSDKKSANPRTSAASPALGGAKPAASTSAGASATPTTTARDPKSTTAASPAVDTVSTASPVTAPTGTTTATTGDTAESPSTNAPVGTSSMFRDTEGNIFYVDTRQLLYLEADRNYTWIQGPTTRARIRVGLTAQLDHLPDFFVRVHRSFAVNALQVKTMHANEIELSNGDKIPVSDRSRARVRAELLDAQTRWSAPTIEGTPKWFTVSFSL